MKTRDMFDLVALLIFWVSVAGVLALLGWGFALASVGMKVCVVILGLVSWAFYRVLQMGGR